MVSKDMYYYDCEYDGYKDIIFSYLDQFNGLITPLAIAIGAVTSLICACVGILILTTTAAIAAASVDEGSSLTAETSQSAQVLNTRLTGLKWLSAVIAVIGTAGSTSTGTISILVSQDKADLMGYWKVYDNSHVDIKLEVPYLNPYVVTSVDPNGYNRTQENDTVAK
jgi:hypothetical protein